MAECMRETQKKPIRGRWVDVNKGDDQMEVYRSRYVAMELKHQYGRATGDGLFAAMAPLEGMQLLPACVASRQSRKFPHKLMFIDISKAYLHADVLSDSIYVKMNMPNMCGRLLRAAEEEYTKTLKGAGFQREKSNPCMYYHPRRDVRVLFHGDDFTVAGKDSELKHVAEVFQNKYRTKVRGILVSDLHDMKAMTILNRIVGRNPVRSGSKTCRPDHRRTGTRECEWVRCDRQQSGYQRDRHRVGCIQIQVHRDQAQLPCSRQS